MQNQQLTVRMVAKEVLGEQKGKRHTEKEAWRCSVEVQEVVREETLLQRLVGDQEYGNHEIV